MKKYLHKDGETYSNKSSSVSEFFTGYITPFIGAPILMENEMEKALGIIAGEATLGLACAGVGAGIVGAIWAIKNKIQAKNKSIR